MQKTARRYEMDMTEGPLLWKILRFALPVLLTSMLQLLYNAADTIVVGQFAGATALAAVGSTGSLNQLIVTVFMGMSIGTNVVVARHYGAKEYKDVSEAVHTSVALALVGGVFVAIVGVVFSKPLLQLMGSPEDVIDLAALYMRIYFLGMPANLLCNFGSAVLRAVGDTKRPLYYLSISGIANVVLNLIFVIVFHMSVAGVAIATVASQVISVVLIFRCLMHTEGAIRYEIKKTCLKWDKVVSIVRVGVPAGIQSSCFALSNVVIQSTVNSFGSAMMAGNAAAGNIEGFNYMAMNSVYQAAMTFTSQNLGAKKRERIGRVMLVSQVVVIAIGLCMGMLSYAFRYQLLGLYTNIPEVMELGAERMGIISRLYFLCGMMDVVTGGLRGLGYSFVPMIISVMGICVLRILWVIFIFPFNPRISWLYVAQPVSWIATLAAQTACYLYLKKKVCNRLKAEEELLRAGAR